MKNLLEKIEAETLWGFIFGVLAIVAIIVDVILNGINASSIVGGVKDAAGTFVTVMVFIVAAKALYKKEPKTFAEYLDDGMCRVMLNYSPLLRRGEDEGTESRAKKLAEKEAFELSTNIESLITGVAGEYARFCEFDKSKPKLINFYINKTTFMGRSKESFELQREMLTLKIQNGILRSFKSLSGSVYPTKDGFAVAFDHVLGSKEDAETLVELIDRVAVLYIAECKK